MLKKWLSQYIDLVIVSAFYAFMLILGFGVLWQQRNVSISAAMLWALAFIACGALFGFLFGIPRTLHNPQVSGPRQNATQEQFIQNTSLEQIADWLTKIIVGVGLVELRQLPDALGRLAAYIAPSIVARTDSAMASAAIEAARPMAVAIVLYFFIYGFLAGYLLTRIYLVSVLRSMLERAARRGDAAAPPMPGTALPQQPQDPPPQL